MTSRRGVVSTGLLVGLVALALVVFGLPSAEAHHAPPYPSGPDHEWGEMVAFPMVFPVGGTNSFSNSFYSPRCCDPGEIHHAIDLMSAKMTPVYAIASGTVESVNWSHRLPIDTSRCCTIGLAHDGGWETWYIHLNNDTPGTDDGQGWGIAEGIVPGAHVAAGQLIGWVGDSGNAEGTSPHLHFELMDSYAVRVNPYEALRTARDQGGLPRCQGVNATIFGDSDGNGIITGTAGNDVIFGTAGDDDIRGLGGNDIICGGEGRDTVSGGDGADTIYGDLGSDFLYGDRGPDTIYGGKGNDRLYGGKGADTVVAGAGDDRLAGGDGDDILHSDAGLNRVVGGEGTDEVTYADRSTGVSVDLRNGLGTDEVLTVENVTGSPGDDVIQGDDSPNHLVGGNGADLINGSGGDDDLAGGNGDDWLDGGSGDDTLLGDIGTDNGDGGDDDDVCLVETPTNCES